MRAREQERKEIEALHRWEEAHIFEGGGNIAKLHNPARSCFQLWPTIGGEGDKICTFVHVNLCWPSLVKT